MTLRPPGISQGSSGLWQGDGIVVLCYSIFRLYAGGQGLFIFT